jgi:hypothetical protein
VPVTARLSKAFYDQLGEQVANELVEWMNLVDLTWRNEMRAANDASFARFEAVLDARFAQANMGWEAKLREAFEAFEVKLDEKLGLRLGPLEARITLLETRLARLEDLLLATRREFQDALLQQFRWMIGLWMTSIVGILAVLATVLVRS